MMMGFKLLMIFVVLHAVASNEVQNGTVSSYDPSELLLKKFNPNNTVVPRQAGFGFRFEDDLQSGPSGPADENQGQYGLITLDDNIPIRFQDDGTSNPDPNEEIPVRFHPSGPTGEEQGQYGLINFDDDTPLRFQDEGPQISSPNVDRPIRPQNSVDRPVKFEDSDLDRPSSNFQDDNRIENHNKKKRKRRRRKPKRVPLQPGLVNPGVQELPGVQGGPGVLGIYGNPGPYQGYGAGYGYPGVQGVRVKRRRRRPRPSPSLATEALTAVTGALTSIARYDDYQCVPRLLCEAAGGNSLGSGGVLDSIAGIQPLLTLLSAYNGISTSPLFVFGRAVFLGMTSKGNTGTCRYAYSQCPNDPEQLIHYLNNHNGGFFRFFNAPPNQNLEQFYQHLGQNGLYQGQNGAYLDQNYYQPGQNGFYQPSQNSYESGLNAPYQLGQNGQHPSGQNVYETGQNYYQTGQNQGQNGLNTQNQFSNQGNYGTYPQRPSLYGSQNYGQNYAYDYNNYGGKIRFRDMEKIEKRIQNKPAQEFIEDPNDFPNEDYDNMDNFEDNNVKWAFPNDLQHNNGKIRDSNALKFPEGEQNTDSNKNSKDSNRKRKGIFFPNYNNSPNKHYNQNYGIKYVNHNDFNKIRNQQSTTIRPSSNNNNYYNQNNNNYKPPSNYNNNYKRPNDINNQNNNNYKPANNLNNNYTPPNNYNNYNNNNYKPSNSFSNNYNPPNNFDINNYKPTNSFTNNNYKLPQNNYNNNYKGSNNYNQNTYFNNNDYYYDHKHNFYVKKENNPSNKVYDRENNRINNNFNNNDSNKVYDRDNNRVNNNFNNNDYYYDHNHNIYVKKGNNPSNKVYDKENDRVNTVYIVRGNGDPNNPEIVKLRPGQSVY